MQAKSNSYAMQYRRQHPDKAQRWRYDSCLRFVRKYELEHPEAMAARMVEEYPDLASVLPGISLEQMEGETL